MATVICRACGKEVDQRVVPGEICPCRCHAVRDVVVDGGRLLHLDDDTMTRDSMAMKEPDEFSIGVGNRSMHGNRHMDRCANVTCPCYRDALIAASLAVRRAGNDLLACDLEDLARIAAEPERCDHPFWTFKNGEEACRTCGADVSHIDPMGG